MRRTVLIVVVGLFLCAVAAHAGVKDSLAYQGRLLDSSDKPVTGNLDVTFSFWTDSLAGTQLYSELKVVSVSSGIFNICLGCTTPNAFFAATSGAPDLFLQVQMAGQAPMSPRTRIRNTPSAMVAARVLGDVTTSAGRVAAGDVNGDGAWDISVKPETTGVHLSKGTGGALIESSLNILDDRNLLGLKTYQPGQPHYGNITFEGKSSKVSGYLDCDDDGDGLSDSRVSLSAGHGGGGGGGAGGAILLEADLDGDGLAESAVLSNTSDTGSAVTLSNRFAAGPRQTVSMDGTFSHASHRCETDSDGDGVPENSVSSTTTTARSELAIKTKGTSAHRMSVTSSTSSESSSILLEADLDGDGVAENHIGGDCDDTDADFLIAHEAAHVVQQRAGSTTARCVASGDLDGDGVLESSASSEVEGTSVSYSARQGSSGKTKRCAGTADNQGARTVVAVDFNSDGLDDRSITSDCDDHDASIAIDEPGVQISMSAGSDSAAGISIDEPGVHFGIMATPDSVTHSITMLDGSGNGLKVKEKGNRTKCTSNLRVISPSSNAGKDDDCDDAKCSTVWSSSSGGTTTSVTIQASSAGGTHPIEVSGGAYCDGTTWVNVSDASLKENFQSVDGEKLLDKIAALPVSEWNYKSQEDGQKHIGPTAQDFQKIFGVGSDGRSISTIDPSGIALAAIKQLDKQNRELKEQNADLKRQLDDLKKVVEEIRSKK